MDVKVRCIESRLLPEDQSIACEIYRSQFQDIEIIDQLIS